MCHFLSQKENYFAYGLSSVLFLTRVSIYSLVTSRPFAVSPTTVARSATLPAAPSTHRPTSVTTRRAFTRRPRSLAAAGAGAAVVDVIREREAVECLYDNAVMPRDLAEGLSPGYP